MAKNVDNLILYIKPTCTTCKKVLKKLSDEGVEYETIDYFENKLTKKKIRQLLDKIDVEPGELLRKRDKVYREQGLGNKDLTKKDIVDLLYENPGLIQRPIIEKGDKVFLGRPVEKVDEIL